MDLTNVNIGDRHYMAYVGDPTRYDLMAANQFCLLCTLGLRAHHHVLDVGCGSLRAGRLLIPYLNEGRYFGIEPNTWLIEEAIANQLGNDFVRLKHPRFDSNSKFDTQVFAQQFDFILAQSIFSHACPAAIKTALQSFHQSLKPSGLIAATFVEGKADCSGSEWVYPGCVRYRPATVKQFADEVGLFSIRIPWYLPEQTWYLLAKDRQRLPTRAMLRFLHGAVLFDPELVASWSSSYRIVTAVKLQIGKFLPQPVKNAIKKLIGMRTAP